MVCNTWSAKVKSSRIISSDKKSKPFRKVNSFIHSFIFFIVRLTSGLFRLKKSQCQSIDDYGYTSFWEHGGDTPLLLLLLLRRPLEE